MKSEPYISDRIWKLSPLILHPFADSTSPQKLVQSSRANLMLQGLLPNESLTVRELETILLDGRYCEVRMLYYVGKDLLRWIDQCVDFVARESSLQMAGIEGQSFADMLIEDLPTAVREKLRAWGVADYKSIFSRALGLNAVFADAPERTALTDEFIRNYHHYADQMYVCRKSAQAYAPVRQQDFEFELFASGEYSRMLERQWQEN
jgi:hypothetical protein